MNKQYRQLAYVQFSKEEEAKNAIADKTTHVISGKPVTVRPIADEVFAEVLRQHTNGDRSTKAYTRMCIGKTTYLHFYTLILPAQNTIQLSC